MAHLYEVQTNKGTHHVDADYHHDHMSKADFERMLVKALLDTLGGIAQGIVLHNYTYRGRR